VRPPGRPVEDGDAARVIGDHQAIRQVVGLDQPAGGVGGGLQRACDRGLSLADIIPSTRTPPLPGTSPGP